jgi:hypothetical protein
MSKVSIYVAYHKESHIISNEIFKPIHVGRTLSDNPLSNMIGDDTGDNISYLNPIYCETTAIYWAWKNDVDSDYIGLCHYRRFFSFQKVNILRKVCRIIRYYFSKAQLIFDNRKTMEYCDMLSVNTNEQIDTLCRNFADKIKKTKNDINVYATSPIKHNNKTNQMWFSHLGEYHLEVIKRIIKEHYAFLYDSFLKLLDSDKMCSANMSIMKRDVFNNYCTILFGILTKYRQIILQEQWCKDELNEKCFARIPAYMAELFTAAFIEYCRRENPGKVKNLTYVWYSPK